MKFKIKDIALLLGGEVVGDDSIEIDMIGSIEHASKNQLSFLANLKYEHFLYTTQAGAVLVNKDFTPKSSFNTSLIKVDDAYTAFSKILEEYKKIKLYSLKGIEESVVIGNNVNYGEDFYLGSFSYIMNNVTIGNNVKIHPQCYIGENVTIGDNTIIYPGVKIFEDTVIGNGCIIKSGAVIGSEGFGFAPQPDGSYRAVPQLGNVIIEDEVSIGANTTIDCATLSGESTRIKRGSKIDNLVQLGHNVQIGVNTVIAAETGIAGSTIIGDNCMIGGQTGISGHLKIANRTNIGAQSGVMKSITEEGTKVFGTPSLNLKNYLQSYSKFKNLPEIEARLNQLEEKILNLRQSDGIE